MNRWKMMEVENEKKSFKLYIFYTGAEKNSYKTWKLVNGDYISLSQ